MSVENICYLHFLCMSLVINATCRWADQVYCWQSIEVPPQWRGYEYYLFPELNCGTDLDSYVKWTLEKLGSFLGECATYRKELIEQNLLLSLERSTCKVAITWHLESGFREGSYRSMTRGLAVPELSEQCGLCCHLLLSRDPKLGCVSGRGA